MSSSKITESNTKFFLLLGILIFKDTNKYRKLKILHVLNDISW